MNDYQNDSRSINSWDNKFKEENHEENIDNNTNINNEDSKPFTGTSRERDNSFNSRHSKRRFDDRNERRGGEKYDRRGNKYFKKSSRDNSAENKGKYLSI